MHLRFKYMQYAFRHKSHHVADTDPQAGPDNEQEIRVLKVLHSTSEGFRSAQILRTTREPLATHMNRRKHLPRSCLFSPFLKLRRQLLAEESDVGLAQTTTRRALFAIDVRAPGDPPGLDFVAVPLA